METSATTKEYTDLPVDALEELADSVGNLIEFSEENKSFKEDNQKMVLSLGTGVDRAIGSLPADGDGIAIDNTNVHIHAKKVTKKEFMENGVSMSGGDISIPYDPIFAEDATLIVKAIVTSPSVSPSLSTSSNSSQKSKLLIITAQSSSNQMSISDSYSMKQVDVKGLSTPFEFVLDVDDDSDQNKCVYYADGAWIDLTCQTDTKVASGKKVCCSDHMTIFSVMEDLGEDMKFVETFAFPTIIIFDSFIIICIIVGFIFDKKGMNYIGEERSSVYENAGAAKLKALKHDISMDDDLEMKKQQSRDSSKKSNKFDDVEHVKDESRVQDRTQDALIVGPE